MDHRFDSFVEAFDVWSDTFDSLKTLHATSGTQLFQAYDGCPDPVDRYHFYRMYAAIQTIRNFLVVQSDLLYDPWDRSSFYESIYWAYKDAPPAVVTMESILAAMITATDDDFKSFIGIVDAYRVGLWNKPFDSNYYAALARGFKGGF